MTIEKLALYGEMYPFLHEDQPYWWFDREHQTVIARDFLESEYGFDLQRQNIDEVVWSGFLPMFTVDIPALAMEYAKRYFEDRLWRELKALTGEDQWRRFGALLHDTDVHQGWHWREYKRTVLLSEAEKWIRRYNVRLKKDERDENDYYWHLH